MFSHTRYISGNIALTTLAFFDWFYEHDVEVLSSDEHDYRYFYSGRSLVAFRPILEALRLRENVYNGTWPSSVSETQSGHCQRSV